MPVNKSHDEFYTLDMSKGWEVPAGYPAGSGDSLYPGCVHQNVITVPIENRIEFDRLRGNLTAPCRRKKGPARGLFSYGASGASRAHPCRDHSASGEAPRCLAFISASRRRSTDNSIQMSSSARRDTLDR